MANFSDEQVMLCLAALCYRGFSSSTVGRFHVDAVGRAMARGLDTLAPLEREWELVWGPAAYRSPFSLLDDELMYVVRRRRAPARYVVAIRGTNPVSAFDWLFGDFWACQVMQWPFTTEPAAVSLSSALGLAVLQRLRSERLDGASGGPLGAIVQHAAALSEMAKGHLSRLTGTIQKTLDPVRAELAAGLGRLAQRASGAQALDADSHLQAVLDFWRSNELALAMKVLDEARRRADPRLDLVVLSLLEHDASLRANLGTGIELLPFLAGAVAHERGPVDVVVTGHSKGGALAPTVALWLAETQGPDAPASERWDPQGLAAVHCYAYAGPTAGDAAFASRSNAKLGGRCHRFANPFDVVPHAWMQGDLKRIPGLYDDVVTSSRVMRELIGIVCELTKDRGYTQIDSLETPAPGFGGLDAQKPLFFDQFVYQHMDAYLAAFGFGEHGITTQTFFDPLA